MGYVMGSALRISTAAVIFYILRTLNADIRQQVLVCICLIVFGISHLFDKGDR